MSTREVAVKMLGRADYKETWDLQEQLFQESVQIRLNERLHPENKYPPTQNHLILVEHPHVYTLGKSGSLDHLLIPENELHTINAQYYKINRGGDITYHGIGQLVGYPIWDLESYFYTDIHRFLRDLEEAIIFTIGHYGIKGGRIDGLTGVWVDWEDEKKARKICAMGIRCSRWITMHGFALNVNTDLNYFNYIVPCGIKDKDVTSIERELGRKVDMEEVIQVFLEKLKLVFNLTYKY